MSILSNVMGQYNTKLDNTAIEDFPRYDFATRIKPQVRWLTPVTWLLSYPDVWKHKVKIHRDPRLKDIKPPYLLICNHNSFTDFKVMTAAIFPHRANYVVALDGFIGREWLMRKVGCIAKRKFVNDVQIIRQTQHLLSKGQIVTYYPEARYSLIGTPSELPESFGKMAKYFNVPVVSLIMNGHHIDEPAWNQKSRGVPLEASFSLVLDKDDLARLSPDEIDHRLAEAMHYDDFAWQRENQIEVHTPDRAEGLHRVLYQCPQCKTEYRMTSQGARLSCQACGATWEMNPLGVLHALEGDTIFSHPPDWYEWQRENVRSEIEAGTYSLECEALIDSLPNADGFVQMGKGTLKHDMNGFVLCGTHNGKPFEVRRDVIENYAIHIEYNYIDKKMDCVDISTIDDTYFVYPTAHDVSVTKISLATEELYKRHKRNLKQT